MCDSISDNVSVDNNKLVSYTPLLAECPWGKMKVMANQIVIKLFDNFDR